MYPNHEQARTSYPGQLLQQRDYAQHHLAQSPQRKYLPSKASVMRISGDGTSSKLELSINAVFFRQCGVAFYFGGRSAGWRSLGRRRLVELLSIWVRRWKTSIRDLLSHGMLPHVPQRYPRSGPTPLDQGPTSERLRLPMEPPTDSQRWL